ncbi:hypothetical protein SLE2022_316950 [Rubroshorea leprosula]
MMGCGSWFLWILGLGIILAMVGSRCVHATISCSDAIVTLTRCKPFLTGGSRFPSVLCCVGLSNLNHEASTTKDRPRMLPLALGSSQKELRSCLKSVVFKFGCPSTRTLTVIRNPFLFPILVVSKFDIKELKI